jgi:hypothetical protein
MAASTGCSMCSCAEPDRPVHPTAVPANAHGRVLDVGWERRPKLLVDRQSDPSLDWVNTCTPGGSLSLLGVQLQSPVGALAERLA